MGKEPVRQGAVPVTGGRVDREAGGLVDDDDGLTGINWFPDSVRSAVGCSAERGSVDLSE